MFPSIKFIAVQIRDFSSGMDAGNGGVDTLSFTKPYTLKSIVEKSIDHDLVHSPGAGITLSPLSLCRTENDNYSLKDSVSNDT
ncbi:hypothetical protein TNCV_1888001 [Trichonephila clavipes]|nr:hypothetical protein TNCV_1888001 [Trichonephila clavipes]